jgi:hypothetical protein
MWSFNAGRDERTNRPWGPTQWVPRVLFRGVRLTTSVDIKIEWNRISTPTVCFHDVYRVNRTFSWGVKILWSDYIMISFIGRTTRCHTTPAPLDEFSWNFDVGSCVVEVKKVVKSGQNIGYFTWIRKYVLLFIAVQKNLQLGNNVKEMHCCISVATLNTLTFLTVNMYVNNNEEETCCCFSLATMVTRTRHNGTLHVYGLSRPVCMPLVKPAVKPTFSWLPSDITLSYATAWLLLIIRSLLTTRRMLITFGCDISRRCIACLPLHFLAWISFQFQHLCWI